MRRPHLQALPPVELPPGYRLRTAGREDAKALSGLQSAAFEEAWDLECTCRRLLDDASVVAIYVIEGTGGRLAATASSRLGVYVTPAGSSAATTSGSSPSPCSSSYRPSR